MNKRLVVRQNGYRDCAVACLVSIMRYYNVYPSHEEVSYHLNVTKDGTNAYNIINGSKKYGFDGIANHYTLEEVEKLTLPVICHTIKNNMYHFIVLYKVNKNTYEIMDPSSSITKIKKSEFKKMFLNTCIYIYPIKKIIPSKTHKSLYKFIFDYLIVIKKDVFISLTLSLIVVILNLIVNYFLTLLIDLNYYRIDLY